jgi:5-deoxy-D-glucuronate isomerase
MATFEAQVEAQTSLEITSSTTPTQNELSQFLKDGVIDVTARTLKRNPQDFQDFIRTTGEQTANGKDINGAQIVSVVKEAAINDDWKTCTQLGLDKIYDVVDVNSLYLATHESPNFIITENGKVNVYPAPSSGGSNSFNIYYINNVPVDKAEQALVYSHSDIGFFADDKVYLVVMYASIKAIEAKIASYTIDDEDLELVQGLQVTLATLKDNYEKAFVV